MHCTQQLLINIIKGLITRHATNKEADTLEKRLIKMGAVQIHWVNQLDKGTQVCTLCIVETAWILANIVSQGLMVVALNKEACSLLTTNMEAGKWVKKYVFARQ